MTLFVIKSSDFHNPEYWNRSGSSQTTLPSGEVVLEPGSCPVTVIPDKGKPYQMRYITPEERVSVNAARMGMDEEEYVNNQLRLITYVFENMKGHI